MPALQAHTALSGAASRVAVAQAASRRAVIVKAAETRKRAETPAPEWVPEPARPALEFFDRQDVPLSTVTAPVVNSDIYAKYIKQVVESEAVQESFGWKEVPEVINGRAAMIGFVAGASAELFGSGSLLQQAAVAPQAVLLTLAVISASSIIPVYYGKKGDYYESLLDVYSLPKDVFSPGMERIHGRIAMLGLFSLLVIELLTGSALL